MVFRPQFLWEPEVTWEISKTTTPINKNDLELKKEFFKGLVTKHLDVLTALENPISDWSRMVGDVAVVFKLRKSLLSQIKKNGIKQSEREQLYLTSVCLKNQKQH